MSEITSELKKELLKMVLAKGKISIADNQLRRYISIATQCDCVEEFDNFMHYQIGRENGKEKKEDLIVMLEDVKKINKIINDEKTALKAIGYYFGYMTREQKYLASEENGGRK
ncbi:MAG TPA: hypothetical protein PLS66_01395 [Tepiditoga sp.]|nr:hypothetical protein [Tepiditoga sp.]